MLLNRAYLLQLAVYNSRCSPSSTTRFGFLLISGQTDFCYRDWCRLRNTLWRDVALFVFFCSSVILDWTTSSFSLFLCRHSIFICHVLIPICSSSPTNIPRIIFWRLLVMFWELISSYVSCLIGAYVKHVLPIQRVSEVITTVHVHCHWWFYLRFSLRWICVSSHP